MTALRNHGLVRHSGASWRVRDTAREDFPMLDPSTPPLPPDGPFSDNLDEAERRFGVAAPKPRALPPSSTRRGRPPLRRPDPALPVPARTFVGPRVGYGGALHPLTFTIRGGEYSAKADLGRRATFDAILGAVEAAFFVKRNDICSPRRDRAATYPRFAVCLLAVEFTDWSLPRIGRALAGRDHTTVMHGIDRARWFEANDKAFGRALDEARARLRVELPARESAP